MNISTHTYKETEKKEKATVCLARPTKREEQERWQQQQKREKESDDHAHAHTHTHTSKMALETKWEKNGGWTMNKKSTKILSFKPEDREKREKSKTNQKDSAVPSIGHLKKF